MSLCTLCNLLFHCTKAAMSPFHLENDFYKGYINIQLAACLIKLTAIHVSDKKKLTIYSHLHENNPANKMPSSTKTSGWDVYQPIAKLLGLNRTC